MGDDGTVGVFLRSFKETDRVEDLVELFRVRGDVGSGGKDREEVIQVMCELPTMQCFEYPVNSLREEIEYPGGCT
jgi:hypothetical protein